MSRLTTLLYGSAEDAADVLGNSDPTTLELSAALVNALRRIATLERQMTNTLKIPPCPPHLQEPG